jgi:PadR family transcriptional regulator PadR
MTTSVLGPLELTILLAVARLGEQAHGLAVRRDISARTGHDYSVGAVYTTLGRLEEKGLVSSRTTAPVAVRGGRSRREFQITGAGRQAVRAAQQRSAAVWAGFGTSLRPARP